MCIDRGRNKIVLSLELFYRDFKFKVWPNLYLVHAKETEQSKKLKFMRGAGRLFDATVKVRSEAK